MLQFQISGWHLSSMACLPVSTALHIGSAYGDDSQQQACLYPPMFCPALPCPALPCPALPCTKTRAALSYQSCWLLLLNGCLTMLVQNKSVALIHAATVAESQLLKVFA